MKKLRKFTKKAIPVIAVILLLGLVLSRVFQPDVSMTPEATITADQANDFIGKVVEVCGEVASARYVQEIGGQPTFINLGQPHPDQHFTVVIWGDDRLRWRASPEQMYSNRNICVTGRIELHEGTPQIIAENPDQISVSAYE